MNKMKNFNLKLLIKLKMNKKLLNQKKIFLNKTTSLIKKNKKFHKKKLQKKKHHNKSHNLKFKTLNNKMINNSKPNPNQMTKYKTLKS